MKKMIALAAAAALVLAACGDDPQTQDATTGAVDDQPQFVMLNVDGWPNVAARCFGPLLIMTTSIRHGSEVTVIGPAEQTGLVLDGVTIAEPICSNTGEPAAWLAQTFTGTYDVPEDDDE